jgi:heterodisulfide reductase subunit C
MTQRAHPKLLSEIQKYGEADVQACFNCGNCTAICPLATDATPFPRNNIRLLQLGLKDRLRQSLDPWLCYYCGDCSATCPRQAEPAEAQMTMRRWLTAQYDWTGLARRFYTSIVWEVGAIVLVGAFIALMFALFHGPVVTDRVELNTFAPVEVIHTLDGIMAAGLSFFLLSNVFRMYLFTMRSGPQVKAPLSLYVSEAWNLIYHFATQKRFSKCDDEKNGFWRKPRWRNHWLLVSGYVTMFALVVGFLPWFQTDNIYPLYHPQRWLGYYATVALLFSVTDILWGRIKKAHQMHRFSHPSDWIFPILLLLATMTGILVHTFRYLGLPLATYITYAAHLSVVVPMLTLEVPFGKWSHLAYRPFAVYFQTVKEKALARQAAVEAVAPAS